MMKPLTTKKTSTPASQLIRQKRESCGRNRKAECLMTIAVAAAKRSICIEGRTSGFTPLHWGPGPVEVNVEVFARTGTLSASPTAPADGAEDHCLEQQGLTPA